LFFTGPLTMLFNNKLAVILGKLSYSVFLVNLTIMMMSQSSQRLPVYLSAKSVVSWNVCVCTLKSLKFQFNLYVLCLTTDLKTICSFIISYFNTDFWLYGMKCIRFQIDAWIYDTVKSYMMALVLYLVVEVPFAKLIKPWI